MRKIKTRRSINTVLGLGILLLSFILLIPGLFKPMITMSGSVKILVIKKQVFNETRSIVQTIDDLVESENYFVAVLILFFSVLVPFIKGMLLLFAYISSNIKKELAENTGFYP